MILTAHEARKKLLWVSQLKVAFLRSPTPHHLALEAAFPPRGGDGGLRPIATRQERREEAGPDSRVSHLQDLAFPGRSSSSPASGLGDIDTRVIVQTRATKTLTGRSGDRDAFWRAPQRELRGRNGNQFPARRRERPPWPGLPLRLTQLCGPGLGAGHFSADRSALGCPALWAPPDSADCKRQQTSGVITTPPDGKPH